MVLAEIHEDWLTDDKAYPTFEEDGTEEAARGKVVTMAANQFQPEARGPSRQWRMASWTAR